MSKFTSNIEDEAPQGQWILIIGIFILWAILIGCAISERKEKDKTKCFDHLEQKK